MNRDDDEQQQQQRQQQNHFPIEQVSESHKKTTWSRHSCQRTLMIL
jgi:hypothetical protein